MIKKLLIANRGEIVSRIIKTCRNLGVKTAAVYSEADKDALFVRQADESFLVGPANPIKSYLNIEAVIEATKECGADAIHPGYGFLSESFAFAEATVSNGIIWIGPSSETLRSLESKCYCRKLADQIGVPVNPGTLTPVGEVGEIHDFVQERGFPVFLKLDKGGGGKGIEIIREESQIREVFERTSRIGLMAFGSPDCYIEEVVSNPRHIEVQFLGDRFGDYVCLGERECSIQRKHQKIIEESPSPVVTEDDREALFERTLKLARSMKYQGAGTMEFLRAENGEYYFMEINARIQVEHPVTEFLTGVDIVECQLEIASGEKLSFKQEDIEMNGHSIEARVYAEDPETFMPSPGTISALSLPEQTEYLRIDHALEKNGVVPPYYDPLLAKVISWGENRPQALRRLKKALKEFYVEGIKTTAPLNVSILESRRYADGDTSSDFIEKLFRDAGGQV